MTITILSCSLHPMSRSHVLARQAEANLKERDVDVRFVDLRDYEMPFCGRADAWQNPAVDELREIVGASTAMLMAAPIYNFDINAAAKNLVELTGRLWTYKVVGFMCAAGGRASYMSVMGIANSLMLDFRCLIVPRFVYAAGDAFGNDRAEDMYVADEGVLARLKELTDTTVALTRAYEPVMADLMAED